MKVLIIDDDNRNIFALKTALKSRGVEALGCLNPLEGLGLLDRGIEFDVVLLDMMMPEFDGFQFLDHILSSSGVSYPPVISVTAKAMKGDRGTLSSGRCRGLCVQTSGYRCTIGRDKVSNI
jgi:CheY-like chemotaxis protein